MSVKKAVRLDSHRPFSNEKEYLMTFRFLISVILFSLSSSCLYAGEPSALNPFGQGDAGGEAGGREVFPGRIEMSDGTIHPGFLYLTREKRLEMYDKERKRRRQIPLNRVVSIEAVVKKEWMEKEWRFKELADNEKMYTGREYPVRMLDYTVTLDDGKEFDGPAFVPDLSPAVGKRGYGVHRLQTGSRAGSLYSLRSPGKGRYACGQVAGGSPLCQVDPFRHADALRATGTR